MTQYAERIYDMAKEADKLNSLSRSLTKPNIISFGAGAPALEAYTFDILREISQENIVRQQDLNV